MAKDGEDLVGHFVDVPEVDFQHVAEYFRYARLLSHDVSLIVPASLRQAGEAAFAQIDSLNEASLLPFVVGGAGGGVPAPAARRACYTAQCSGQTGRGVPNYSRKFLGPY